MECDTQEVCEADDEELGDYAPTMVKIKIQYPTMMKVVFKNIFYVQNLIIFVLFLIFR